MFYIKLMIVIIQYCLNLISYYKIDVNLSKIILKMFNIILYQPEIPPNTGNIIRLCANAGFRLHLIKPLGFNIDDKHLKRAGLDYEMSFPIQIHNDFSNCASLFSTLYLCTTKAKKLYTEFIYKPEDAFVFGPETRGLPEEILTLHSNSHSRIIEQIRIPMRVNSRSLNLSNSVSIILYEAWRQNQFN